MDDNESNHHAQETQTIWRDFKVKVALAAIQGDETAPQLAARHGLHPTQTDNRF